MHVQYDPNILMAEAGRLYQEADRIVAALAMRGALLGILLGLVAGAVLGETIDHAALVGAFVGAVLSAVFGGIIGAQMGQARAFFLRLEAQRTLVLAQIEFNTRARR